MARCSVVLQYEKLSSPLTLGMTYDPATLCIVKQQILKEAREKWEAARAIGDPVMVSHFELALKRLQETLDKVVAPEIEGIISRQGYIDESPNGLNNEDE